jgi:hypothetical protein
VRQLGLRLLDLLHPLGASLVDVEGELDVVEVDPNAIVRLQCPLRSSRETSFSSSRRSLGLDDVESDVTKPSYLGGFAVPVEAEPSQLAGSRCSGGPSRKSLSPYVES